MTPPTKSSRKKKAVAPPPESKEESEAEKSVVDDAEDDVGSVEDGSEVEGKDSSEEEEDEDHLYGFSSDDEDSSDEDIGDSPPLDIQRLPTIAKDDLSVKRRLEKAKLKPASDRGTVVISRLPHGFYEDQLRGYFTQFGDVTRLRVSRNKKTGKSKHYAFLEFDSSSVAQIVAETMDNYLLMGHILKCKVIPQDKVHPELWVGANRKFRVIPQDRMARLRHHKPRTEEEQQRAEKRLLRRQNQRKRKLAEAGIKYDFEAVAYKKTKGSKSKV
ncbi:hypothetical protein AX16_010142 [Volvariella volvacea WC 439]|nr:hypothetical protein AX16_010142 [Volvariella volvacea WC 439]